MILLVLLLLFPSTGFRNPAVTQYNIQTTICNPKWLQLARPSSSYTRNLKIKQMKAEGMSGTTRDYEEDHIIPLGLGGHPSDPRNLWPEPIADALKKDKVETYLHRQVCIGTIRLWVARRQMKKWKPLLQELEHNGKVH